MQYTIKLFAGLAEKIGESQIIVEVPSTTDTSSEEGKNPVTVQHIKDILSTLYPDAEISIRHSFAAVNQEYATVDTIIKESDELALIPPVSGGSGPLCHYQCSPLSRRNHCQSYR